MSFIEPYFDQHADGAARAQAERLAPADAMPRKVVRAYALAGLSGLLFWGGLLWWIF